MNVLGIIHFLLVILVCFALESFWEDYDWSAFAPVMSETKYYPISRYPLESKTPLPLCLLRFPMGTSKLGAPESTPLSLGDFGLMASLTYETSSRAQQALEHYFAVSEWRIERRPETDMDWVRFLMFTSSDNSTTVITVRGTMDFLDVLQDVALWLVPALMQAMNFVGPDVSSGAWGQAISSLSRLIPLSTVNTERSFSSVLAATEFMIKSHPERLFYLAGHSLGGGVAKLVALKLSAYAASPLTLAFSAPGIAHAARVMFGELPRALHDKLEEDEMSTLTVKPMHDIISRIDIDLGNSVVTPCEGRAWQCHSIYRTLWGIFKTCGSMTHRNLTVPCGWSPEAPC